jgi:hypothetical protein
VVSVPNTPHENGGETISPEFLSPQLPLEVLVPAKTVSIPMRCSGPVCTPQASPASPSVNVHVRVGTESPTLHVVPLLPSTTVRDLKGLVLVRASHGLLLGLGHWRLPHHAFTALLCMAWVPGMGRRPRSHLGVAAATV